MDYTSAKKIKVDDEAGTKKDKVKGGKASFLSSAKKIKVDDEIEEEEEAEVKVEVNDGAKKVSVPAAGMKEDKVKVNDGAKIASVSAAGKKEDVLPPKEVDRMDKVAAELLKKQADFDPKKAACWKEGEPVPFIFLARALDRKSLLPLKISHWRDITSVWLLSVRNWMPWLRKHIDNSCSCAMTGF